MKKNIYKQGFSLIEVIVAFSVLTLVIVAATNLLVTIIRSNNQNENTMVAYGLAQEGLEAMRNVRDSNWLLGADFQGRVGGSGGKCLWAGGVCFPDAVGVNKYFSLQFRQIKTLGITTVTSDQIPDYSPWQLKDVTPSNPGDQPSFQETQLYLEPVAGVDGDGRGVWYQPCFSICTLKPSQFSRYVEVTPMVYDPSSADLKIKKYLVSSVVRWLEIGRPREVRLTTEITDWKGGTS